MTRHILNVVLGPEGGHLAAATRIKDIHCYREYSFNKDIYE